MDYSDFVFTKSLREIDPDVAKIIEYEEERQVRKIIMIPSESICPSPVLQALGTAFNNIYAEGYPPGKMTEEDEQLICDFDFQMTRVRRYSDRRFYKGCDYANLLETLAQRRASELFATEKNPPDHIYVNVQPLSGAAANNAVYDAFVQPGDVVMGMSLMDGGHLTHGSEFNRSGKNYRIISYAVSRKTEKLDYSEIMNLAQEYRPKMIIAGYTSYPWYPDWSEFRKIADSVGAVILADISHPAGMVAAGVCPSPVDFADVITCTTHKTLFGPRGALIMTTNREYAEKIDEAVFPGEQGGPHVNKFAAMAVAFQIAKSETFRNTQKAIVENAQYLGSILEKNGLKLAYGGTDTHILLIDLHSVETGTGFPLKGEIAVRILDLCGIVANKNTIPGDTVTAEASGIRLGTPWITQRGIKKGELEALGSIIALVLKNIKPFFYRGLTGDLPRGKINSDVLEEATRRVDKLAQRLASEKSAKKLGYPHYSSYHTRSSDQDADFMGKGIIMVKGARAVQFLEGVSTGKVSSLDTGEISSSLLLDRDGKLISAVVIYRMQPDKRNNDRFLIICLPKYRDRIKIWFRGLSDGYVSFDSDDIFRKIEGPVIVTGIHETSDEDTRIIRDALDKIKNLFPEIDRFEMGTDSKTLFTRCPAYFDLSKPYFIAQKTISLTHNSTGKEVFTYIEDRGEPQKSCLHSEHLKLTSHMVEFAGWEMPVRYNGIIEEHTAVRTAAGLFDISHMGILEVSGRYATQFLDSVASNYVPWIERGESQYSYLLDIEGNVIDDIMLYKLSSDRYMIVVNAINAEKDLAWMNAVNSRTIVIDKAYPYKEVPGEVNIKDLKDPASGEECRVDIALQGPRSLEILKGLADTDKVRYDLESIEKTRFIETELGGIDLIVSRTGYTGEEIGYELFLHPLKVPVFWNLVLDSGKKHGVMPVGLGARNSLRIEAGLPLYGHELAGPLNISPIEAGFGPYVKFHKPFFIGRDAQLQKMKQSKMMVVRFRKMARGMKMSKQGDPVISKRTQKVIGTVTSCAVNQDGIQVGMAYVDGRSSREGAKVCIMSLPHGMEGKSKSMGEVMLGDRVPLHDEAVIISRFPVNDE